MTVSAFVNHEYVIILLMKLFFILISGFFCGIALVFLLYPLFLHKQPAVSVDSPPTAPRSSRNYRKTFGEIRDRCSITATIFPERYTHRKYSCGVDG